MVIYRDFKIDDVELTCNRSIRFHYTAHKPNYDFVSGKGFITEEDVKLILNASDDSENFANRCRANIISMHPYASVGDTILPKLREMYRILDREEEEKYANNKFKEVIYPALMERADCKGLWYEVWVDLDESWIDKWFSAFRYMEDKQIIDACANYLNEQDRFYASKDYVDYLNDLTPVRHN